MRLATVRLDDETAAVRIDGDTCVEIEGYADVGALLAEPRWSALAEAAAGRRWELGEVGLDTPVRAPGKVVCTGLNYRGHIEEMGKELPSHPTLFAKFADTLTGPFDPVEAVEEDPRLDWEGELVAVIGRTAHRVGLEEAADCIAGYTVANDISMRGWQNRTSEWLQGKVWSRTTPVGPFVVTPDELDRDTAVLVTTRNGEVVQKHGLDDLIFTPEELVSYISTIVPLRPGDLVLTGTPGGVGHARQPQVYLAVGDVVEVAISGLGALRTEIV